MKTSKNFFFCEIPSSVTVCKLNVKYDRTMIRSVRAARIPFTSKSESIIFRGSRRVQRSMWNFVCIEMSNLISMSIDLVKHGLAKTPENNSRMRQIIRDLISTDDEKYNSQIGSGSSSANDFQFDFCSLRAISFYIN